MIKNKVSKKRVRAKEQVSLKEQSSERRDGEMDRAQVWSIDVLLAVVIFISIILIFYVTISSKQGPKLNGLQQEAASLKAELEKNPGLSFLDADDINYTRLQNFSDEVSINYSDVKEKLGIRGEFCIFYEDEQGNLVLIDNRTGIGSGDVNISGTPCGQKKIS
ncbi:MAG: hypothetical protein V1866_04060 [archaeon]